MLCMFLRTCSMRSFFFVDLLRSRSSATILDSSNLVSAVRKVFFSCPETSNAFNWWRQMFRNLRKLRNHRKSKGILENPSICCNTIRKTKKNNYVSAMFWFWPLVREDIMEAYELILAFDKAADQQTQPHYIHYMQAVTAGRTNNLYYHIAWLS